MKKYIILLIIFMPFLTKSQTISTVPATNWNNMRLSGFYESVTSQTSNLPNKNVDYYWGINIAHTANKALVDKPYHWGGQILFEINRSNQPPVMYIRSTRELGEGIWAKVLHNKGTQSIEGDLNVTQNISTKGDIQLSNGEITYVYNDNFNYDEKKMGYYAMKWVFDSWHSGAPTLWQSGLGGIKLFTGGQQPRLVINTAGNVGIGTNNPKKLLDVAGTIHAQNIEVDLNGWSDFVFDTDYKLPSLKEVEAYIQEYKHLPNIPSEKQVKEEGINIGEIQNKLLQKIEELTLYTIEQQKQIDNQNYRIKELEERLSKIK